MVSLYMFFFIKVWAEIECTIHVMLPHCVKTLLTECGFSSLLSISQINDSKIVEIEDFVDKNRDIVEKLECCYAETYKSLRKFRFLPAHRLLILHIAVKYNHEPSSTSSSARSDPTGYSFFLQKLIESAEENSGIPKNRYRYDKDLQLFSTYIFLSCGRSCYETLSSNLSIPPKTTVCKFQSILKSVSILIIIF